MMLMMKAMMILMLNMNLYNMYDDVLQIDVNGSSDLKLHVDQIISDLKII